MGKHGGGADSVLAAPTGRTTGEGAPAPQFQAIPWSWAARPMTAADLGLPERAPPYHWLGREAE